MNLVYYVNILACSPLALIHKLHTWSREHSRKQIPFLLILLPSRYLRDLTSGAPNRLFSVKHPFGEANIA